ncbi:SusD/RagB family nutrient-binding outer membrane lipoprotein [Flavobacterium circumlabens]|uniref:SusD-like starch-binding protein associating with outer membrane n=1 Tax=Flavobacterium circumlabens TaxID=2133765 RepID=A0A4Y7UCC4_9FLAO|nr:SusD/RagB family nutrient-binding outer membrane lipoprotein [Flavobacterium circumlabens]TCN56451.1 SusD-like starch-binding protein associating with outer membrane [Flavobacterium circumlabens]TEB43479.1 SusD/RagB family nutrient-binding outer membrane lipoprotein [Flavobacterium circumlabens]
MKKLKYSIFFEILGVSLNSCDNLEGLNEDTKAYVTPVPEALMTSAQEQYAIFLNNASANRNNFRLYVQQWSAIAYPDESRYEMAARSLGNSNWQLLYRDVLKDLIDAQNKIANAPVLDAKAIAVKQNKIAILEIQIVQVFQTLVDLYGNVPYFEAVKPDNWLPKYDDGLTIYKDLATRLTNAISKLNTTHESFGKADLIYGGDVAKWKKYGNSIQIRLGMQLSDVDAVLAKTLVESAYNSGAMTSNADNAIFQYTSAKPHFNPNYEDFKSRADFAISGLFADVLNDLKDPRRDFYFDPASKKGGVYVGAPYGFKADIETISLFNTTLKEINFKGDLFDYAETSFLLADAANRGWAVGPTATHYNNGITASMKYWGVADANVAAYLAQPNVAFTTAIGSNAKERIAYQMWIAYYNRGFEAWTAYRRLDFPKLQAPSTAVDAAEKKVPVRMVYSHLASSTNGVNYTAASAAIGGDKMTTKLFWDKY